MPGRKSRDELREELLGEPEPEALAPLPEASDGLEPEVVNEINEAFALLDDAGYRVVPGWSIATDEHNRPFLTLAIVPPSALGEED